MDEKNREIINEPVDVFRGIRLGVGKFYRILEHFSAIFKRPFDLATFKYFDTIKTMWIFGTFLEIYSTKNGLNWCRGGVKFGARGHHLKIPPRLHKVKLIKLSSTVAFRAKYPRVDLSSFSHSAYHDENYRIFAVFRMSQNFF